MQGIYKETKVAIIALLAGAGIALAVSIGNWTQGKDDGGAWIFALIGVVLAGVVYVKSKYGKTK